ncbi:endonuclease III [Candidatus Pacearchaeota archaeon]|nr:endonuclease III [Candidatus Pacearchaeota archaeon]
MKKKIIEKVMNILSEVYNSNEKTTLNRMRKKPDAFKILISCLLSLRVQDKGTEIASNNLFAVAQTPQEILNLPTKRLEKLIYSSGHYKRKSMILKNVSKEIITRFNGHVPCTKEELMSIKYIGPKTANIVLAFAFGQKVLPIDTHCHRIPNRLGWVKTKKPEETEIELGKVLPKKYWTEFNAIFVQFGKTICVPISPKCSSCPVSEYCSRIEVTKFR